MKYLLVPLFAALPLTAMADPAVIEDAIARNDGNTWSFSVTLSHPDSGWDHYADGWEVLTVDGKRLGYRELAHPHVNEQPFTRSLGGVDIPPGVKTVNIRAKCSVDGWTSELFEISLDN